MLGIVYYTRRMIKHLHVAKRLGDRSLHPTHDKCTILWLKIRIVLYRRRLIKASCVAKMFGVVLSIYCMIKTPLCGQNDRDRLLHTKHDKNIFVWPRMLGIVLFTQRMIKSLCGQKCQGSMFTYNTC